MPVCTAMGKKWLADDAHKHLGLSLSLYLAEKQGRSDKAQWWLWLSSGSKNQAGHQVKYQPASVYGGIQCPYPYHAKNTERTSETFFSYKCSPAPRSLPSSMPSRH